MWYKNSLFSGSMAVTLMVVVLAMTVVAPGLSQAKEQEYSKKLFKQLKEFDLKDIPGSQEYPGAEAIVVLDSLNHRQFFGFYSIWSMTYQDEINRVWKIVNPDVDRLKTITLDLGETGDLESFELQIFNTDGDVEKLKKGDVTISDIEIGGKSYRRGTLELPALKTDTVLSMEYIVTFSHPLFWDFRILGGPDPIVRSKYRITLPEFQRNSPAGLYRPCAYSNPFAYRFRALDATKKKFITQETDKEGFFFVFDAIPAWKEIPYQLPQANSSSYIAYSLNEMIVPDPVAKYDEKFEKYMQIPQNTDPGFIRSAGSPEAFKYSFEDWDSVADYLYAETLIGLTKSDLFEETARTVIGEQTIEGVKLKVIYDYVAKEFSRVDITYPNLVVPSVKDLETAITKKQGTSVELGLILWGLLKHAGANPAVGFGFLQKEFVGVFDHKFPIPRAFTTSVVRIGEGASGKLYYPGEAVVPLGSFPPELAGSDILFVTLKSEDELKQEPANASDPKNPYISVRARTRVKTDIQGLDPGNPTVNKVVSKLEFVIAEDGSIAVKADMTFGGFKQIEMRRKLEGKSDEEAKNIAIEWVKQRSPELTVTTVDIKNREKRTADLQFVLTCESPFSVKDDKISIPFSIFNESKVLPMKPDMITGPNFLYPYRFFIWDDFMVTFEKGWEVDSAPENSNHQAAEGMIKVNVRQNEIQFNYQRGFSFVQVFTIEPGLEGLRSFLKKYDEVELKDTLVLKRKK